MTYPGNPALSPDVRQRIRSTFRQTLDLAAAGSRQEASLGCDFILQLDPEFSPAQRLAERLSSGEGAVPVDDLRAADATEETADRAASADAEEPQPFSIGDGEPFDLGGDAGGPTGLDEELPDMPSEETVAAEPFDPRDLDDLPSAQPVAPPAPGADLHARLSELVAARRFGEAVELAARHRETVASDPALAEIASTAVARQEASPYVESFVAQAREAAGRGDRDEERALLAKAAALDPSHPEVAAAAVPAATPEPVAAGGGTTADAAGEDERVAQLLAEGQAAFDQADYQGAIDLWSRIFLIDIDHAEAASRIEAARRLKSEHERRVEEVFHEAEAALDAGDREAARAGYARVLEMSPGHLAARERLDRLEAGGEAPPRPAAAGPAPAPDPAAAAAPAVGDAPLREEILVPPEPGEEQPTAVGPADPGAVRSVAAVRESHAGRNFLLIGSLVLVLVAAAAWFLWINRESIFPNAGETTLVVEDDPIGRATKLHDAGRTEIAVNQLRRLPPSSPQYEEAQALISQWEAADEPAPAPAPSTEDLERERRERQRTLLDQARAAAERGEFLDADEHLAQATALGELDDDAKTLARRIDTGLAPVSSLVALYRDGEFERVLPEAWRMHEEDGSDPDVDRLLVDSYYNLAVQSLQRGDAAAAAADLEEALSVRPDDPVLARHHRFAAAYAQRDKDLLYRIYVKYLPPR